MILHKLCWLLVELALAGLFLVRGNAAALAVAAGLVLVPLCGVPIRLAVSRRLRLHLELLANLRKGDGGAAVLVVENPTIFPVLRLQCRVSVENRLHGSKSSMRVLGYVRPKGSRRIMLEVGDAWCGRLTVRAEKLRLYDGLGLLAVRSAAWAERSTTVQPDTFGQRVQLLSVIGAPEDSELYSDQRPGADLTETFQIREYVEGDSPRQIHWKLTGKFDRLIVRDPSLPIIRSVLIFWERTGDSGEPAAVDAQAEAVITLCKTLLDQSVQFTMGWNDTSEQRCILQPVHDLEELVGLTPRILAARGQEDGTFGAELLLQTLGDRQYSHIVYIGAQTQHGMLLERLGYVTILTCGDTGDGWHFDPQIYPQQLAELTI